MSLVLFASAVYAGKFDPRAVSVDLVGLVASGDLHSARSSVDPDVYIGCGSRYVDFGGTSTPFAWGFCQAEDSEGESITCFTENRDLINEMKGISDYSYISFIWQDDGSGGHECVSVRFSTQSLYHP